MIWSEVWGSRGRKSGGVTEITAYFYLLNIFLLCLCHLPSFVPCPFLSFYTLVSSWLFLFIIPPLAFCVPTFSLNLPASANLLPRLNPTSLQLWHLLLLERPFTTDSDTPDSEPRLPGGRLGSFNDLSGLGGGPIGGSVPAGLGGPMGGLLGASDHWGPGRPPRLHSQRRYRSRGTTRPDRSPAVEGWVTDWFHSLILSVQFSHSL